MSENENSRNADSPKQAANADMIENEDSRNPVPPNAPQRHPNDAAEFKTIRNLLTAGNILGPVSIFIGGVFASMAGLICGLVARRKMRRMEESEKHAPENMALLKRSCSITLAICGVALVLNAVSLVMTMGMLMQMIESGEFANLIAQNMGGGTAGSATGSSTWG